MKRSTSGTPQGGVISPLLANLYLHYFDKVFHAPGGPAHWAKAKLVRYADDFVVLARSPGPEPAHLHRDEAGDLDGVGDQSGENAGGPSQGGRERAWTFWGSRCGTIGTAKASPSLPQRHPSKKAVKRDAAEAARADQQQAMLQAVAALD